MSSFALKAYGYVFSFFFFVSLYSFLLTLFYLFLYVIVISIFHSVLFCPISSTLLLLLSLHFFHFVPSPHFFCTIPFAPFLSFHFFHSIPFVPFFLLFASFLSQIIFGI